MITSIRIDDNKRTPFKYTSKIKALVIIYQFTPPYKKIDKSHFY